MVISCYPWGMFEGLSHPQKVESIARTTFAASSVLGDLITKLFSSNFMGIVRSVLVIFDTVDTY